MENEIGNSGGGFDKLRIRYPSAFPPGSAARTSPHELVLNRRGDSRPNITIDVPWYGGGMSFGSTNIRALLGKARVAKAFHGFTCTGEGGYPERFVPYKDHVITQVATGLFGVREETIQNARIVEFKYAQGAKPGLGGHLLGDKNTPAVAAMREAVVGTSLFSPFPFHSVYSVEDHKKHLDWIAHVNPKRFFRPRSLRRWTWTWWRWACITRRSSCPGRQLRRHGGGSEHRQEKHRHADRVRDQSRPPIPSR